MDSLIEGKIYTNSQHKNKIMRHTCLRVQVDFTVLLGRSRAKLGDEGVFGVFWGLEIVFKWGAL